MKVSTLVRPDILGVIIGVAGVLLAFVFYLKSKERARPAYAVVSSILIGASERKLPTGVEITYDGRPIHDLNRCLIFFWNRGQKTLDKSDIVSSDPIIFHTRGQDVEVLEVRSVKGTRAALNASAVQSANDIFLAFDFLDQDDGITVEVLASGTDMRVRCSGTIKGVKKGIERRADTLDTDEVPMSTWLPAASTRALLVSAIISLVSGIFLIASNIPNRHGHASDVVGLISGITITTFGLIGSILGFYFYTYERIPLELRKAINEDLSLGALCLGERRKGAQNWRRSRPPSFSGRSGRSVSPQPNLPRDSGPYRKCPCCPSCPSTRSELRKLFFSL
jgi:hypothetical protein